MTQEVPPLSRRFLARLGGSLISLPLNLGLQAVAPRALGPVAYGNYAYLSAWFTETIGFLEGGSSQAFFAKWSQRPTDDSVASFFSLVVGGVALALPLLIIGGFSTGLAAYLWPGLSRGIVALAALMAFGNWLIGVATRGADVHGRTIPAEAATVVVRALLLAGAVVLAGFGLLGLESFLGLQVLLNFVLVAALLGVMARAGKARPFFARLSRPVIRARGREYWSFTHPLLSFALIAVVANLADRWLLQRLGGAAQQGFFGVSASVGAVIFLLAGALVALLTREFANAYARGEHGELAAKFRKMVPATYAATAAIGVFCAVHADTILTLLVGEAFREAHTTMVLMCIYPLHQTYGQLNGGLLIATDQTRLYRNIGVVGLALGPLLTWWLLADRPVGGMALGAAGLALKMVLVQFLVVNVQLHFVLRRLGLGSIWRFLLDQLVAPATLWGVAWLSRQGVEWASGQGALSFVLGGILYSIVLGAVLVLRPSILLPGILTWRDLRAQIASIRR